ncbi:DNA polymerase delta catalytic subunit [Coemansia sp. RSA 2681]|nr:DNA polymerase delta catalytic subunit [Coemansia sp. RSA 2681]
MEVDQEHNRSCNAVVPRLFGVTESGHSVVCYVQGFFPYFYCPAPDGFKEEYVSQVVAELNRLAQSTSGGSAGRGATTDAVVGIEMCMKEPMFGYYDNKKAPFFKIIVRNPKLVRAVSQIVEHVNMLPIIFKRLHIEGSALRSRPLEYQRRLGEAFGRDVLPHIKSGEVFWHIDRVYAWENIQDAHCLMESASFTGKIVVRVTDNIGDLG